MDVSYLKKNNFIQGAFIATFGIVASKILGILYVVPFHDIIGEQGGALYGYAYNLYNLFLSISTIGLPLAVSKLVSEYNALGYYNSKEKAYRLAMKVISVMSVIAFLTLFIFAPFLARAIMGDITGGNTIEDITYVVRISSLAIVFVAALSVVRGYLQGHKYITPSSISQVVEQFVRVIVLLAGSYAALNIFHLALKDAVGVAVFGACAGAMAALLYLLWKIHKSKELKPKEYEMSEEEKQITDKQILKRLLMYALPFVFISFITSSYDLVDMLTVVKTLVNTSGFSAADAESVMSAMTTWGGKLSIIVTSVASGVTVSLIPNIASSFVKNNMKDVTRKINKAYQMVLYTTIPMATGLSLLAVPVWNVFYGHTEYGANVFCFTVLLTIFSSISMNSTIIMQSLNQYKVVFLSLLAGLIWNATMNVPMMNFCYYVGLPTYYGATIASMIGYAISTGISLYYLHHKFKISYKETFNCFLHVIVADLVMIFAILLVRNVIPINVYGMKESFFVIIFYAIFGALIYFGITTYDKTIDKIFGMAEIKRILKKIPLVKKLVH